MGTFTCVTSREQKCGKTKFKAIDYGHNRAYSTNLKIFTRCQYIIYSEVTLFGTVPLVRLLGPNGPQLVNARQYLNVVIIDHLVARAELRVGLGDQAETVTITRG